VSSMPLFFGSNRLDSWSRPKGSGVGNRQDLEFPELPYRYLHGIIILFDSQYKGPTYKRYPKDIEETDNSVVMVRRHGVSPITVRRWINRCGNGKTLLEDDLHILLIDVRAQCLTWIKCRDTRCVTLRYVWGNVEQFKCSKANPWPFELN
jgi:hypothetical protein